jgi:hypothetical protein
MNLTPASDWNNEEDVFHYETIMNAKKAPASKKVDAPSKKPCFVQCGLISRQQEYNELGAPSAQAGCYGCCYLSEKEVAAVPYEEIEKLINMIRKTISKTSMINLAVFVAAKYAAIRNEINSDLDPNEEPLPEWTAATILEHLRSHNADPELHDWNTRMELHELAQIAMHASVIRNVETGEVKIDPVQAKIHLEYLKQMEALSKSDPSNKNYYSGGNHFDIKAASEGPISLSGRRMFSKWKS